MISGRSRVVLHARGRFPTVADDLSVGQDDGQPRVGLLAERLAEGVDLGEVARRQQGTGAFLGQPGAGLQVVGGAVDVELPQRRRGVPRHAPSEISVISRNDG